MEGRMSEAQHTAKIRELENETKRLYESRRALKNLAIEIREFCPGGEPSKRMPHDWSVVRADSCAVFGGGSIRSVEFECECGATMSIADGPSQIGCG